MALPAPRDSDAKLRIGTWKLERLASSICKQSEALQIVMCWVKGKRDLNSQLSGRDLIQEWRVSHSYKPNPTGPRRRVQQPKALFFQILGVIFSKIEKLGEMEGMVAHLCIEVWDER